MSIKYYLKYFYFIGSNWNFKLALFTVIKEIKGEKKYDLDTIELDRLKGLSVYGDNLAHASIYQGANYFLLEKAFDYLQEIKGNQCIVDFGCGKGRVLVVAAYYGFKKITGIEFARALCVAAERNIAKVQSLFPSTQFKVICDDAINYKIEDDQNVFFFFNPFDEVIMLAVAKNILKSLKENSRHIFIVYLNPLHKEIFLSAGFEEEYYLKKMEYLELSILSNEQDLIRFSEQKKSPETSEL
ncbi:MAG: class I SAM-dependent methyltransferase [Ginsengibacter sp.]